MKGDGVMNGTRHEKTVACHQFELELQAYLERDDQTSVPAHIRECAFCSVLAQDLEALRAAALTLPLEEPSPVVWSNIRAQLAASGAFKDRVSLRNWIEQLRFIHRPVPVAAFACLVLLGCLLTGPRNNHGYISYSGFTASPAITPIGPAPVMGNSEALKRVIDELEATFKARESSLSPELQATYEKSLKSLDASIQECSDSLQDQPGNALAHEYLATAYSQKAEVLSSALVEFDQGR